MFLCVHVAILCCCCFFVAAFVSICHYWPSLQWSSECDWYEWEMRNEVIPTTELVVMRLNQWTKMIDRPRNRMSGKCCVDLSIRHRHRHRCRTEREQHRQYNIHTFSFQHAHSHTYIESDDVTAFEYISRTQRTKNLKLFYWILRFKRFKSTGIHLDFYVVKVYAFGSCVCVFYLIEEVYASRFTERHRKSILTLLYRRIRPSTYFLKSLAKVVTHLFDRLDSTAINHVECLAISEIWRKTKTQK